MVAKANRFFRPNYLWYNFANIIGIISVMTSMHSTQHYRYSWVNGIHLIQNKVNLMWGVVLLMFWKYLYVCKYICAAKIFRESLNGHLIIYKLTAKHLWLILESRFSNTENSHPNHITLFLFYDSMNKLLKIPMLSNLLPVEITNFKQTLLCSNPNVCQQQT